jgi:integrase
MLFSVAKGKRLLGFRRSPQSGRRLIDERVNSPFWKERQLCLSAIWPSKRPGRPIKSKKCSTAAGLYLEVAPSGGKLWRLKYRFGGKEKLLALGPYPLVGLKEAREKRDAAKKLLLDHQDPGEVKRAQKLATVYGVEESFEYVAREWIEHNSRTWVESHSSRIARRLEQYVFPWIGKRRVSQITAPELLSVVRQLEKRGTIETAHRVFALCGQVLRYAVAAGRAERDITPDLRGALTPVKETHLASITEPREIGRLLAAIDAYDGFPVTRYALLLAPLVFLRPGEFRKGEWKEIDFEEAEWRIPAHRMKMKIKHIVPLSRQALEILTELRQLTGTGTYMFPGARSNSRPMSDATVLNALGACWGSTYSPAGIFNGNLKNNWVRAYHFII